MHRGLRIAFTTILLVCAAFTPEVRGADNTGPEGTVTQVAGDLAYIQGLNGSAPLWSRLEVPEPGGKQGTALQVIKELDEVLVARVIGNGAEGVDVSDPVRVVGSPSQPGTRRIAHATRVARGPAVDGRLDDAVWRAATPVEGLVQQDPECWMPGSERTVARILYDEEQIYFGFDCAMSDMGRLVANNMRRDSEIYRDDSVQILLDTYNDRQTGFYFFVNPLGAQMDLVLSNEGRTRNYDWDCNWTAKTRRTPAGWTAEIAIPSNQLRFRKADRLIWGVNLSRRITSKNEQSQLVVGKRTTSRHAKYSTADIAELHGLESILPRRLLQVKPYVLPGASRDLLAPDPGYRTDVDAGADLRVGLAPSVTLDVSYNTDFAQVEADQERVNLTEFSRFFPEKREFFLEGATLFDFGEASSGGGRRPPNLLFYSRRIGLEDGWKIPIILGSKLVGKRGRTSFGALNALTGSRFAVDEDDTLNVGRTNFSVVRVKQDVLDRSNVGFILVNKQSSTGGGGGNHNRAGGIDLSYSPSSALNVQGFVARTLDSGTGEAGNAGFTRVTYDGSRLSGQASYLDVGTFFEPAVGFVSRRGDLDGFRRYEAEVELDVRPTWSAVRSLSFEQGAKIFTDRSNNVVYWDGEVSSRTSFNSGDSYGIGVRRRHTRLDEPSTPSDRRPEVEIPAGEYTSTSFSARLRSSSTRKLQLELDLGAGAFYTGRLYRVSVENTFSPSGRLSLETEYETNWVRLPQGNVNLQTLSSRLVYAFTTDLFVKLFGQWNNDSEFVSLNFLANYRFRPGSDFYLVYDQAFGTDNGLEEQNRALLLKLSYLFSL